MSRIGRLPIPIPEKVSLSVSKGIVKIEGPRGKSSYVLPEGISARKGDGKLVISRIDDTKPMKTIHGTTRAQIANEIIGVFEGHKKTLLINGKGYQAEVKGNVLEMQLGFSHRVVFEIPKGLEVEVKMGQNSFSLVVTGNSKQLTGAFAAELYKIRPVEPYNMIGFRYSDQYVRRKTIKTIT